MQRRTQQITALICQPHEQGANACAYPGQLSCPCSEHEGPTLCLDLGSVASDSMCGISSDLRYTPAEEQKMYCGTSGRAFKMGSASEASRPFRSYTAASQATVGPLFCIQR